MEVQSTTPPAHCEWNVMISSTPDGEWHFCVSLPPQPCVGVRMLMGSSPSRDDVIDAVMRTIRNTASANSLLGSDVEPEKFCGDVAGSVESALFGIGSPENEKPVSV